MLNKARDDTRLAEQMQREREQAKQAETERLAKLAQVKQEQRLAELQQKISQVAVNKDQISSFVPRSDDSGVVRPTSASGSSGSSGVGISILVVLFAAAAFWQFGQNKKEKTTHVVSFNEIASDSTKVRHELANRKKERQEKGITEYVRTKEELEEEKREQK